MAASPGTLNAGLVSHLPLGGSNASDGLVIEGWSEPAAGQEPDTRYRVASPDYFGTIGATLESGRSFSSQDTANTPLVAVVNESLARRFFQKGDAIGSRIRFSGPIERNPWREIVGVVKDVRHDLTSDPGPETYIPYLQETLSTMFLVAKTEGDPATLTPALRSAVTAIDPDQPVWAVQTMNDIKDRSLGSFRAIVLLISIASGVALFLAAIGIFGVVTFLVSTRMQEIGVRMALGATARDVVRLIVAHNGRALLAGFAVGTAGAFGLSRVLQRAMPQAGPPDPVAFLLVASILAVVGFLASWLPARRATGVSPASVLRSE